MDREDSTEPSTLWVGMYFLIHAVLIYAAAVGTALTVTRITGSAAAGILAFGGVMWLAWRHFHSIQEFTFQVLRLVLWPFRRGDRS